MHSKDVLRWEIEWIYWLAKSWFISSFMLAGTLSSVEVRVRIGFINGCQQ